MLVLIVEDSLTTAATLEAYVSACDHKAICIPSAEFAGYAISGFAIDLILMDIMLPDVDGYQLAARLRAQGVGARIIAVTSLEDDPLKRQQCGIDGYIAKPVSKQQLKAVLEHSHDALVQAT
jgi:two-component system, OmpR family, response regulator